MPNYLSKDGTKLYCKDLCQQKTLYIIFDLAKLISWKPMFHFFEFFDNRVLLEAGREAMSVKAAQSWSGEVEKGKKNTNCIFPQLLSLTLLCLCVTYIQVAGEKSCGRANWYSNKLIITNFKWVFKTGNIALTYSKFFLILLKDYFLRSFTYPPQIFLHPLYFLHSELVRCFITH